MSDRTSGVCNSAQEAINDQATEGFYADRADDRRCDYRHLGGCCHSGVSGLHRAFAGVRGGEPDGWWQDPAGGVFFFNDTATTEIYTLSLHDALPICELHHAGW